LSHTRSDDLQASAFKTAVDLADTFLATASGLMIDRVRSIAM